MMTPLPIMSSYYRSQYPHQTNHVGISERTMNKRDIVSSLVPTSISMSSLGSRVCRLWYLRLCGHQAARLPMSDFEFVGTGWAMRLQRTPHAALPVQRVCIRQHDELESPSCHVLMV